MPNLPGHLSARSPLSNEDWLSHQSLIKKLYLDENRTLSQVMETMASKHKFRATVKMYKHRITKWGFDRKYRKRSDNPSWPNKPASRKHFSDRVSDRVSPIASHGSSPYSVDGDSSTRRNSTAGTNWSPREDSTMAALSALQFSGELEHAICRYFHTSFQSRMWVSDGEDTACRSAKAPPNIVDMILRFKHDVVFASNYIRHEGTRYGFLYLHHGSEKIEGLVSAESPRLIADVIEISLLLIKQDRYDVVRIFLQQFADMSDILKSRSRSHTIYQILAQKSKLDELAFEEAALNAWRAIAACFCRELGPLHLNTLCCYTNWLMYFASTSVCARQVCQTKCDHAKYAESVLRSHLLARHNAYGLVSTQSMVLEALVHVCLVRQNYSAAYVLCHEMICRKQTDQQNRMLFMALQSISEAKSAQQKSGQADDSLKKLIDISAWGRNSSKAIYHMTLLLDILNNTNKPGEAASIEGDRFNDTPRTDPLPISMAQSFKGSNGGTRTFSLLAEENIVRLRSLTRSSERESRCENSRGGGLGENLSIVQRPFPG